MSFHSIALCRSLHQEYIAANGEVSELADVIDVYYIDPAEQIANRSDLSEIDRLGTLSEVLANLGATGIGTLEAGKADTITLAFKMQESAGNEYQNLSIGTFSIELLATQTTSESDSFGTDYDALALYPDGSYRVEAITASLTGAANSTVTYANKDKTVKIKTVAGDDGKVTVTVTPTATNEAVLGIANENGQKVASYDIQVSGQKTDAETTVEIFLGPLFTGVNAYYNGKAMDTYSYDPTTGLVTITIPAATTYAAAASNTYDLTYGAIAKGVLSSFDDINASKGSDGVYVLGTDFATSNIIHFGSGTTVTLDLNGKVITAEKTDQYSIGCQNGAILLINGDGIVNAGRGFMTNKENATIIINGGTYNTTATGTLNSIKHCSVAQNDSKIVINGGTFTTDVVGACLFFATSNARIEINGGFFENTADDTPDLLSMGTNKNNTNRIVITGGTFVNWNPLNDRMCYTGEWPTAGEAAFGGPWMLIPGGYTVVSETQANGDVWYTVVPVTNN